MQICCKEIIQMFINQNQLISISVNIHYDELQKFMFNVSIFCCFVCPQNQKLKCYLITQALSELEPLTICCTLKHMLLLILLSFLNLSLALFLSLLSTQIIQSVPRTTDLSLFPRRYREGERTADRGYEQVLY